MTDNQIVVDCCDLCLMDIRYIETFHSRNLTWNVLLQHFGIISTQSTLLINQFAPAFKRLNQSDRSIFYYESNGAGPIGHFYWC